MRLGTVETEDAPYADEVEEFADAVERLSDGSLDVEIVWEAPGPHTNESEGQMAEMVRHGEIDLAVVPTRVWDQYGVTSFQALQAPFLVDNLGLLDEIAGSDVATEMLAGLDAVGVTGLAMWSESLRHPVSFGEPLLTAADFQGTKLLVPTSDASIDFARAIGVVPVDPLDRPAAIAAGEMEGAESAFVWSEQLPLVGTTTANITFYPKANTIVANTEAFADLSSDRQDALHRAASDTLAYVIETNATEHDLAEQYCAEGGTVVLAQDSDVAELVELAAPVLAELEADAGTGRFVDEIRTMKADTPADPGGSPEACEPAVDDGPGPTGAETDTGAFPEGVYRTGSDLGVVTMEYRDGTWRSFLPNGQLDCESTYVVESGRIWLTASTDVTLACGNPPGHDFLDAAWTLEGDQLRFVDINSDPAAVREFSRPWTKIE
ncbi:MAG TPA: TRAP transporter substrate-binding protein DctP [Acidimicrobiales bacterium]|nr:TRAP transporter substrate-binding protein DctP [Acidimicrobiales bacterium]